MNKKATLSMAIEVIIIVVIALTLLGLGLTFIRGQMKGITETTVGIQEQIKQQILDDLRTGNKPLSFPVTTLYLGAGKTSDQAIGIMNTDPIVHNFTILINVTDRMEKMEGEKYEGHIRFFYDQEEKRLGPIQAEVVPLRIKAESHASGTYLIKITVLKDNEEHATKTFFITVS